MKLLVKKGRTSYLTKIFVQDSASTTGAGKTGLTNASFTCYRARDDDGSAGATQITLSAATKGTWSSGGIVEKDATNMPGVYELGIPDNALATGSETVVIMLKGAGIAPVVMEIQLAAFDPQDNVRLGLTSLPNATAGASNGLPLSVDASGRVDVLKINGTSQTARDIGASVLLSSGTGTGQLSLTLGKIDIAGDFRIRKNTALAAFPFRMTDSADHVTAKTGLSVTGQVSKDGGAFANLTNSVVEIGSGWYKVDLAAADVNADTVALKFTATGADQLDITIATQTE